MGYKKALVAFDGSDHAIKALDAALDMVENAYVRDLLLLYVTEGSSDPLLEALSKRSGVVLTALDKDDHDELSHKIRSHIGGFEEAVDIQIKIGVPKEAILSAAQEQRCDLIIMGSRGFNTLRERLGSVSSAVLRESSVPVLIVK